MDQKGIVRKHNSRYPIPVLYHRVLLIFSLVFAWPPLAGAAVPAAGGAMLANSSRVVKISIQAVNVKLGDLLRRISEQADIKLVLYPRAEELVSLNKNNEELETVIKGLLQEYNFVLHYRDFEAGLLNKIFVISRKTTAVEVQNGGSGNLLVTVHQPPAQQPGRPETTRPPARNPGKVEKKSLGNEDGRFVEMSNEVVASLGGVFTDPEDQLEQSAPALDNNFGFFQSDRQKYGVKINEIKPGSPLALLGLKKDDVIREVNGKPVQSVDILKKRLNETIGDGKGRRPIVIIAFERQQPAKPGSPGGNTGSTTTAEHIYVR
ncbi:MAG: hypothetical protein A2511_10080 [Deltaproteobacteria bacterium RIFOXYD12_FULL_50_9]|nr:MAG: hypothetical protein A2511_10080 [Deltaproteobacteria bacterium RIFOXYD12_FULL_50_9]